MIDLHCHVLPGIDDGPDDMTEAVELCRVAAAAGTTSIAVTPHVSWDYPNVTAQTMMTGLRAVQSALGRAGVDLRLRTGAEVSLSRVLDLDDRELRLLRLGGGHFLLLECPFSHAGAGMDRIVEHLFSPGHRVLLAHPERCPTFQGRPRRLETLVARGALTQITAGALGGRYGETVRRAAVEFAAQGLVHVVSSDGHDPVRRPPVLRETLADAGFADHSQWWCEAVPAAVLEGTPIPVVPPVRAHSRFGGRMRRR